MLFLLAFDGIFRLGLSANSLLTGYADDVTYSKASFSPSDLDEVDSDLEKLSAWLKANHLRLNLDKVKSMTITRKRSEQSPPIRIDGRTIQQVSNFKLLGVVISQDLSWRDHIQSICCRSKKLLGFLYRVFGAAGPRCLGHLYKTLVLPVLDYSSAVWDPPHKIHRQALERVQSFASRLVTGHWSADPATLQAELRWPQLATRREVQKICVCRRILSGSSILPVEHFIPHQRPTSRHKNSQPLFRPFSRTSHFGSSFFLDVVRQWNAVPEEIVSSQTSASFKRKLKLHYYTN